MDLEPRRLELHALLKTVLGSNNVYFQQPGSQGMKFPCIVYDMDDTDLLSADNQPYRIIPRYQVTFIRYEKVSPVLGKLMMLPLAKFNRRFSTSGLNHDVFTIYH